MTTYTVILNYMSSDVYEVQASSPEQATALAKQGEGYMNTYDNDHDVSSVEIYEGANQ